VARSRKSSTKKAQPLDLVRELDLHLEASHDAVPSTLLELMDLPPEHVKRTVKIGAGKNARVYKLGRRPPRLGKPTLRLSYFVDRDALRSLAAQLPETLDLTTKSMDSIKRIFGNDRYGDCVIAGKYHSCGMVTGMESGAARVGDDKEVLDQYHRICGSGDVGCVITDVLDECQAGRFMVGGQAFKIDSYVRIDPTNIALLRAAMFFLGPLTYGIDLPGDWTGTGQEWDVTKSRIVGGHDVSSCAYDPAGIDIATWGGKDHVTNAAQKSGKWISEVYALLPVEWTAVKNLSPMGVDVAYLKQCLDWLKNGQIPNIPPAAIHRFEDLV
jgi:hypothetical protein